MFGETVIIRRRTAAGEDSLGNPSYTVAEIPVEDCAFAPRGSSETVDVAGVMTPTQATVYAPSGTVFEPSDLLVVRGQDYAVDGEYGQWTNPYSGTGWGVEVAVRRVT